jgi:nitrite reductase/ring-hydroxylating ferredoxin subunit
MSREHEVGPPADLPPGTVTGAGAYAVGKIEGELFAMSRRCRHLGADLANSTLDEDGHLICPPRTRRRAAWPARTGLPATVDRARRAGVVSVVDLSGRWRIFGRGR